MSWGISQVSATTFFCTRCQACLPGKGVFSDVVCTDCGLAVTFEDVRKDLALKPALQQKKRERIQISDNAENDGGNRAIVDEECPKCSNPQMFFYTMQLRSVDEGSTVFYECAKCKYTFSINN